jgi:diacylglycerol kinase (ATP)
VRLALVANPASGGDDSEAAVRSALEAAGAEVVDAEAEAERIVVAGGDGTVGVAAAVAAERGLPLAVIPTGTANDFARELEIPLEIEAAARLAADEGAGTHGVDLGWLRPEGEEDAPRPFVNAATVGLSPAAAEHAASLKKLLGPAAYPLGAIRAGLTTPPVRCRVVADGEEVFAGETWQVAVAGTGAFGGGAAVEFTRDDDGQLDVAAVPAKNRIVLVRLAWALRRRRLGEMPGVVRARGSEIMVEVDDDTTFNVDGEVVACGPSRFTAESGRVRVIAP